MRGFLRGFFDADGSRAGHAGEGRQHPTGAERSRRGCRPCSACCCGSASHRTIYRERRRAAARHACPTARAEPRTIRPRRSTNWSSPATICVSFAERVGFADDDKSAGSPSCSRAYRRALNRERFVATVDGVELHGEAEVFDVCIPASMPSMPTALWRTIAASSRCRPMAPACWARSIWRPGDRSVHG